MKQLISLGILALLSLPWDAQAETSAEPRTPLSPATMATVHGQSADSASLSEESTQKTTEERWPLNPERLPATQYGSLSR